MSFELIRETKKNKIFDLTEKELLPPLISIYFPASSIWEHTEKDRIKLKNLLDEVRAYLRKNDLTALRVEASLGTLEKLQSNPDLWKNKSGGTAFFAAEDFKEQIDFPSGFSPQFYVSDKFNIKPLVPYLYDSIEYMVLFLSYKESRLYWGLDSGLEVTDVPYLPEDRIEILRTHDTEPHVDYRTTGSYGPGISGAPEYFGHGGRDSTLDEQQKIYLDEVDWALNNFVDKSPAPLLILAAEEDIYHNFVQLTKYPAIHSEFISGNPFKEDEHAVLKEARQLVMEVLRSRRDARLALLEEAMAQGQASNTLSLLCRAAYEGRIDTLFVDPAETVWGQYSPKDRVVNRASTRSPDTSDLINWMVLKTLDSSGKIYPAPTEVLPDNSPHAGILRY